ncbi:MAG TPA: ATP-binding protein [Chitinophagaceae bacterium]|nr:ATP-binding protein [Chitinophagaceae bacterium]
MKTIFRVITYFLLLGVFCHSSLAQVPHNELPAAKKGVLDLRNYNLSSKPASLNGEWSFFWKQLLQPGDSIPATHNYTVYPQLWKKKNLNGQSLPSEGYASYSLTVLLPGKTTPLALEIPDTYSSYNLYVNGKQLSQNGKTGTNASEAVPFWATQIVALNNTTDTLHIILQVANFWHAKGGTYKEIVIGDKKQLLLKYHQNTALDLILAGCLFMGGLFFWGLSVFGRNDKIIFYFSLFCIVTSYRMIGTDLYVLHSLFPHLNWFISIRLEYLSLVLGVALFSQYTKMLYPKDTIHVAMKAVICFCLLYAVIILIMPPVIFTALLNFFLVVMFLYIVYAFYIYIQAVLHKRKGSMYALLSSGVMLLVYFIVNLQYFDLIPASKLVVFTGYIAFFFLQSLVLSHRFSDILQQAATEAQQGLKAKAEFLSTMSHEIRTPLNAVIGMAHLLKRSEPRKDQYEHLNVLLFSANNLLSIVNNILDYNKIEAGKISIEQIPMDLPAMARNIIAGLQNLADDKQVSLKLTIDPRLTKKIIGDPTRTSQVLNNLVQNAIKFTKEGQVLLSILVEKTENEMISVKVTVADTGIGIAPEKQQLIFERFTQADSSTSRSFGGTGLGLSISKKILEMQGSLLQLKSQPGIGSEFYFTQTFALTEEQVEEDMPVKEHLQNEIKILQGISILLVEDNPFNVLVAKAFLERCGAVIDVAVNGEEGIEKFDSSRHRLVLMDLEMPVMDGYEATRQLRKRGETLPVIALTASLPKEVESEVHAAGLTDIIVKPFDPDDLFRVILQHLKAIAA